MFNNPYMYTRFMPNVPSGMNAMRGGAGIYSGMNAMRGATATIPNMGTSFIRGTTGTGMFSKLGGIFSSLRSFNWGGLINNASKTIGVINQTIPLVKQVGPMVNNMRSVMKIASIFKDETDPISSNIVKNNDVSSDRQILDKNKKEIASSSNNQNDNQYNNSENDTSNSPVFFVN